MNVMILCSFLLITSSFVIDIHYIIKFIYNSIISYFIAVMHLEKYVMHNNWVVLRDLVPKRLYDIIG